MVSFSYIFQLPFSCHSVFRVVFLFPPEKTSVQNKTDEIFRKVTELEEMTEALMLTFEVGVPLHFNGPTPGE